jgi:cytochrome P450
VDSLAALDVFSPDMYATQGYPHAAWAQLRREAPVFWYARNEVRPFWAITRHEDVVSISRQPELFPSGLNNIDIPAEPGLAEFALPPTIISMDPPRHGVYRQLLSRRFTPRALRALEADIERIGREIVDELGRDGLDGECDFVERVAMPLPIAVIAWLLGVPREDWALLFDWTNRLAGPTDPEYRSEGEHAGETRARANAEIFAYFERMLEERRRAPREDLVSLLGAARLEGEPLPREELLSYCMLLVVGGNETTRNATTGGVLAFIENPDQLARVQREPRLLDSAVEEILRWTSPIVHMSRTAARDVELRGQKIRAGDLLGLFYPSANRDEDVFDAPFRFDVGRVPNRHLSFGVGEHICLGAHVARVELRVAFRHLLARLADAELAGPLERLRSSQVGGIKRLPIRYRLRPAA